MRVGSYFRPLPPANENTGTTILVTYMYVKVPNQTMTVIKNS